jgi:CRISPR-associated protein Cmr4
MATYKRQRYLLLATDPVHVGTGGYRLGRVDNSIVREPGTKVPKIPGTSLHGAARAYAAQLYETPEAAGQSQDRVKKPGENPVCYTFGYLKKEKQEAEDEVIAYSGVVNIFDAHVLLFPVHSMDGPVWITTLTRLREAGFDVSGLPNDWQNSAVLLNWTRQDALNLGWLMVSVGGQVTVTAPTKWQGTASLREAQRKIVIVRDALFSQIVNSNLEVRTSVAIDPERGAAEDGALFTYEALPRTTFLIGEVVLDDYRDGANGRPFPQNKTAKNNPLPGGGWSGPLEVARAGLRMIEWLGVGGMGTRGFGRMTIVGEPLVQTFGEEVWQ